jgi:hypothetical protein
LHFPMTENDKHFFTYFEITKVFIVYYCFMLWNTFDLKNNSTSEKCQNSNIYIYIYVIQINYFTYKTFIYIHNAFLLHNLSWYFQSSHKNCRANISSISKTIVVYS